MWNTKLAKTYSGMSINFNAKSWSNKYEWASQNLDILLPQYSIGQDIFLQWLNKNKWINLNYIDKFHLSTHNIK